MLIRRYRKDLPQPFVMWLYPLPALLSLFMWAYVFAAASHSGQLFALGFLAVGVVAYRLFDSGH